MIVSRKDYSQNENKKVEKNPLQFLITEKPLIPVRERKFNCKSCNYNMGADVCESNKITITKPLRTTSLDAYLNYIKIPLNLTDAWISALNFRRYKCHECYKYNYLIDLDISDSEKFQSGWWLNPDFSSRHLYVLPENLGHVERQERCIALHHNDEPYFIRRYDKYTFGELCFPHTNVRSSLSKFCEKILPFVKRTFMKDIDKISLKEEDQPNTIEHIMLAHNKKIESGNFDCFENHSDSLREVEWEHSPSQLIFKGENSSTHILIYKNKSQFIVFTNYSGYIERSSIPVILP